jgi:heat shock protein 1/8
MLIFIRFSRLLIMLKIYINQATIEIDSLWEGIDFDCTISRAQFEELCEDLFKSCLIPVERALQDAGILNKETIDQIVLIGGSTRIPGVQQMLSDYFGGKALCKKINPDEAVAFGAAIQAANLSKTVAEKQNTRLAGLTLMDVTPLSLGIETVGGKMSVIIPRNSTIPVVHSKVYMNHEDNQLDADIYVYEGESVLTKENRLLGTFNISGFPPRPRGQVRVETQFALDANGILNVSAQVKDIGLEASLKITQNKGLLPDQLVTQLATAETVLQEDSRLKKQLDLVRNELQSLVAQLKRKYGANLSQFTQLYAVIQQAEQILQAFPTTANLTQLHELSKQLTSFVKENK